MPLIGYETAPWLGRERKKIALARLENEALDWMHEYGDMFPELRDLCHEIDVQIDKERTQL